MHLARQTSTQKTFPQQISSFFLSSASRDVSSGRDMTLRMHQVRRVPGIVCPPLWGGREEEKEREQDWWWGRRGKMREDGKEEKENPNISFLFLGFSNSNVLGGGGCCHTRSTICEGYIQIKTTTSESECIRTLYRLCLKALGGHFS